MNWTTRGVLAAAAAGGGLLARRALAARRRGSWPAPVAGADRGHAPVWHVVTVYRARDEVAADGRLPEPLAALGDAVEVQLRTAPGDRGTEIAVRLRAGEPSGLSGVTARIGGDDPRWAVRRALRDSKQLLETGEILSPHQPPTTEKTLLNRPLAYATEHGKEEGLL